MKIVTNGKYYRIKDDNGSFIQISSSSPAGGGYYWIIFETRFYWYAKYCLRRYIKDRKVAAQEWVEV